jgi:hypothetical protein
MAEDVEVWESTIEGTVWLHKQDPREKTGWRPVRVGGVGSGTKRVTLTKEEREYNQDHVLDDNDALNPFSNGTLVCVRGRATQDKGRYELSDKDLLAILKLDDENVFKETIREIDIEMPLRRLYSLAEHNATSARRDVIRDVLDERYRPGGVQPSVARMMAEEDDLGITTLSG